MEPGLDAARGTNRVAAGCERKSFQVFCQVTPKEHTAQKDQLLPLGSPNVKLCIFAVLTSPIAGAGCKRGLYFQFILSNSIVLSCSTEEPTRHLTAICNQFFGSRNVEYDGGSAFQLRSHGPLSILQSSRQSANLFGVAWC